MRRLISYALQVGDGVPLVAICRTGVNIFHIVRNYSALAVVEATLAANEIDYAGDTPAAIVTDITDPGYNAHFLYGSQHSSCHVF